MTTILSIQSHVAYGHVGNSASVFPMQRLGVEVWPVHTVNFSNHTGYGAWRGPLMDPADVADVVTGIGEREAFAEVDAVLSGYQGGEGIGATILEAVAAVKAGAVDYLTKPADADAVELAATGTVCGSVAGAQDDALVVILDDVDLYVRRRGDGDDSALGALLSALDGATAHDRVLTIATTNDPRALDGAATRAARFDTVIELDPPDDAAAAAILAGVLARIGALDVDVARVVAALPHDRSGADVSEIVRRAILVDGAELTTATLLSVIGSRAHEAALPTGTYL